MHSPQDLHILAGNCRSLARQVDVAELRSSLLGMAKRFDREAKIKRSPDLPSAAVGASRCWTALVG